MIIDAGKYRNINLRISSDIEEELRNQGHFLTGELEGSMKIVEELIEEGIILRLEAKPYIEELEEGVPAQSIVEAEINFPRLVEWVMKRNLAFNVSEANFIALRIVKHWQKEGKPSQASREFSSTGEILHAVEIAMTANENSHNRLIDAQITQDIDEEFKRVLPSGNLIINL